MATDAQSRLSGADANRWLTTATGILLLAPFAALGVTIVLIGRLLGPHLFIGMLLLGPVLLKLATVGYRFTLYYAGDVRYRAAGPPPLLLRSLGPLVVASTLLVFASGLVLLALGPSSRPTWGPIHKISFIAWISVVVCHVILHLPDLLDFLFPREPRATLGHDDRGAARAARMLTLAGALVAGTVLAILTIPLFSAWTAGAGPH